MDTENRAIEDKETAEKERQAREAEIQWLQMSL